MDYLRVWDLVEEVQLSPGIPDKLCWRWSSDQEYSAASAYGAMFVGSARPPGAKLLWKTAAPPRVKFFFWLVVHRQCWTAARRKQHGLQDSDDCIMCAQAVEMMDHIILGCVLSRQIWAVILTKLHLLDQIQVHKEYVMLWWLRTRKVLPKENRRGFDSLFVLVGWTL